MRGGNVRHRYALWLATVVALGLVAASCSSDDGGGTVEVALQEWAVVPGSTSIAAGEVTFDATNEGPNDPHELVVFATDLAPDALPTRDDGGVDEEGEGVTLIGEIEEFPVGESESATFTLESGSYVLICNLVEQEEGALESHYQEGMRVGFTVE